jgi:hypothetical protein
MRRSSTTALGAILPVRLGRTDSHEFLVDHAHEALERQGAQEEPAVDEEGRRAGHPEADPVLHVLLDRRPMDPARQAVLEAREVQPHLAGIRRQLRRAGVGAWALFAW